MADRARGPSGLAMVGSTGRRGIMAERFKGTYEHILFAVDRGVATITLNRPEVLNAFSSQMGNEVQDAYRRCDADDDVRAVVVTGAGRAFCSGADFSGGS